MNYIDTIKEKVKNNKKTIILPEASDDRVLKASKIIEEEGFADVLLIGEDYLNPKTYDNMEELINKFVEVRNGKITYEEARDLLLNDNMYFAVMLVKCGYADGVVSGAIHSTADTLRPALQIIKSNKKLVSSFFIMDTIKGLFIFSDCALVQDPSSEELSIIAKESYDSYKMFIGDDPSIAMLSHSTLGSAKGELVDKVKEATNIIKNNYPDIKVNGEIQLDAALNEEVAKRKGINNTKSNILIFPNIDAGNIGYKLVQFFGNNKAIGPIMQGLNHPVNDLSRGCSVDDIVSVVAITAYQAIKNND